jgi:signal transduction histidine kinase
VQEALNNAAKHSGTKTAQVEMLFSAAMLILKVRDFGCGLPETKKPSQRGLGLIAMRERAELLGGKVDIQSEPGEGTTLTLEVPLDRKGALKAGEEEIDREAISSKR